MIYSNLWDMIKYLEYGTKLHIGVVFLGHYGNEKCSLPHEHKIHSSEICETFKADTNGFKRCFRCRNTAINKAIRTKKPFGGLCINGIYEYTRPVVIDDDVVCIIYIGNILTEAGYLKLSKKDLPLHTLEQSFTHEQCEEAGSLIESYIRILLEKYPSAADEFNPLIKNIKSYIHENLEYDISLASIAKLFNYNSVYLGRIFKKETGLTIKEYINKARITLSKKLLNSDSTIITVSQKAGFNNVTYFNSIFKKYTHMTPTEYRKGFRTNSN